MNEVSINTRAKDLMNWFEPVLKRRELSLEIRAMTLAGKFSVYIHDDKYNISRSKEYYPLDFLSGNVAYDICKLVEEVLKARKEKEAGEYVQCNIKDSNVQSYSDIPKSINKESDTLWVDRIMFNGRATIIFWTDNTKTVVKCSDEDDDDPYAAVAQAYMKKIFGSNNQFKKMVDQFLPEEEKEILKFDPWIALRASVISEAEHRIISKENQENLKKANEKVFSDIKGPTTTKVQIISEKDAEGLRKALSKIGEALQPKEKCKTNCKCVDCKHWEYVGDLGWKCGLFGEMVCTVNKCIEFEPKEE